MTYHCPHCGADLRARASFCRECGSDAGTGWSDDVDVGLADMPDRLDDDEYSDFLAREFPEEYGRKRPGQSRLIWIAAGVLVAMILGILAALG